MIGSLITYWLASLGLGLTIPRTIKRACQLMGPLVEERRRKLEDPADLSSREADGVLSCMITHFKGESQERLVERLVLRILLLSIVATLTITMVRAIFTALISRH